MLRNILKASLSGLVLFSVIAAVNSQEASAAWTRYYSQSPVVEESALVVVCKRLAGTSGSSQVFKLEFGVMRSNGTIIRTRGHAIYPNGNQLQTVSNSTWIK